MTVDQFQRLRSAVPVAWLTPPSKVRPMRFSFKRTLQVAPGKALLLLDTCHAGRATAAQIATRAVTDIN